MILWWCKLDSDGLQQSVSLKRETLFDIGRAPKKGAGLFVQLSPKNTDDVTKVNLNNQTARQLFFHPTTLFFLQFIFAIYCI